jgi:hypothetical protein
MGHHEGFAFHHEAQQRRLATAAFHMGLLARHLRLELLSGGRVVEKIVSDDRMYTSAHDVRHLFGKSKQYPLTDECTDQLEDLPPASGHVLISIILSLLLSRHLQEGEAWVRRGRAQILGLLVFGRMKGYFLCHVKVR